MFELSFKTKEGDAFQLEIEDAASSTVEELKIRLVSLDVTFEGCTLMFKGKICKDEKTLQDYGMVPGCSGNVVVMRKKGVAVPASASTAAAAPTTSASAGGNTNSHASNPTPQTSGDIAMPDAATSATTSASTTHAPAPPAPAAGGGAQQIEQEIPIDPAVVDNILSMGLSTDRSFIEQMLKRCGGNADQALMWILDPEEMMAQERASQEIRRQQRAQRTVSALNVLPFSREGGSSSWRGLISDGLLAPGATAVVDAGTVLDVGSGKECVILLAGGATVRGMRDAVRSLAMIYAMSENAMDVVYVPAADTAEAKFGEFIRTMPWYSLKYQSPSVAALTNRFQLKHSSGGICIHKPTGNVWSFTALSDMMLHNMDYNTCRQHWAARGHIPRPLPFSKENPTGRIMDGSSFGGGSSSASTQPAQTFPPPQPPQPPQTSQHTLASSAAAAAASALAGGKAGTPAATGGTIEVLPGGAPDADLPLVKVQNAVNEFEERATFVEQEEFFATVLKVLNNIAGNPAEVKYHQIKKTNAKLFGGYKSRLGEDDAMGGDRPGVPLLELAHFSVDGDFVKWQNKESTSLPELISVRNHVFQLGKRMAERKYRFERDEKIKQEMEKDADRKSKYGGGEGAGRMNLGGDRRKRGGG
mmetsp:Transcript_11146/g.27271  ORF Transcript_11146/g.27271 Transcript_11146/m.27271 type:complete len:644 (+) Transcript_11146:114-2045(+)